MNAGFLFDGEEAPEYSVDVLKLNESNDKLEGVKFMLEYKVTESNGDSSGSSEKWYPVYYDAVSGDRIETQRTIEDLEELGDAYKYIFETSSAGTISFKNLFAGSFRLSEIAAPDGYVTAEPIEFTLPYPDNALGDRSDVTIEEDPASKLIDVNGVGYYSKIQIDVVNRKPPMPSLPFTGGSGIVYMIILGAILAIGAAVLYYMLFIRKKKEEK